MPIPKQWLVAVCLVAGTLQVTAPAPVAAQQADERAVRERLQIALGLEDTATILVTREFSPLLFPGATFFSASHSPQGSHTRVQTAAVVAVGEDLFPIRNPSDLPTALAQLTEPAPANYQSLLWLEALAKTLIIERCAAIVSSRRDLQLDINLLEPKDSLTQIVPPSRTLVDGHDQLVFFLKSSAGVRRVLIRAHNGNVEAAIATIASTRM